MTVPEEKRDTMNKGVELLLKRMESHPEEFEDHFDRYHDREPGKWDNILHQVLHRVEVIDRDNGHKDASNGVRAARYGKPLGYLSDEEVLTLLAKLDETRAMLFERKVMATLLGDERPKQDIYKQAAMRISASGAVGIGTTSPSTILDVEPR